VSNITSFSTSLNDTIHRTDFGAEDRPEGDLVWLATRPNWWSSTVISQKASGMHKSSWWTFRSCFVNWCS